MRRLQAACGGAAVLLAVGLSLGGSGCFFDTRTPETPTATDTSGTRWRPPSSPQVLVTNIEVTFEDRQIDFYRRGFRTDFVFRPDLLDSADYSAQGRFPFDGWDEMVEEQVAQIIMNSADRITMVLSDVMPRVEEIGLDTARIRKAYEFSLVDQESVGGSLVTVDSSYYQGILTLFMRDEAGGWALYRWEDTRPGDPGLASWGRLRAETKP